jgi:hypothetical protein
VHKTTQAWGSTAGCQSSYTAYRKKLFRSLLLLLVVLGLLLLQMLGSQMQHTMQALRRSRTSCAFLGCCHWHLDRQQAVKR